MRTELNVEQKLREALRPRFYLTSANVAAGSCTSLRTGDWQTQGRSSRNIVLNGHYISRQPDLLNMDDRIYQSHVRQGNASRWFMSVVVH